MPRSAIADVIDSMRPAVEADGGTIELHSVAAADGVVRLTLNGSCAGCPSSTASLEAGIARILRDHDSRIHTVENLADPGVASETSVAL